MPGMADGFTPLDSCWCGRSRDPPRCDFITIEDETGPRNIVSWPTCFEKRRRVVLGSSMMAINGRIQREGEVVLSSLSNFDLSGDLVGLADSIRSSSCRLVAAMSLPTGARAGFTRSAEARCPARHVHTRPTYHRYAESEEPEFSH